MKDGAKTSIQRDAWGEGHRMAGENAGLGGPDGFPWWKTTAHSSQSTCTRQQPSSTALGLSTVCKHALTDTIYSLLGSPAPIPIPIYPSLL